MATTYYLSPISMIVQYLQNSGFMAAGGFLYTYEAGTNTPVTTYPDSTGTVNTPNGNPNPMTLSSTGRPASASGAPVAFWVPAGTDLRLIVTDSLGNQLVFIDNIPSINDLSGTQDSLATNLANPAAGEGASLVANAMISYQNFAALRAGGVPSLASGQTLIVAVQGGASNADGLAALFYWNATSSAADNGSTIIAPTGASSGRYLLIPEAWASLYTAGTYPQATQFGRGDGTWASLGLPQNAQKGNYTTVMSDMNGSIFSDGSVAATWTIDSNASVAYPIGTVIAFENDSSGGSDAMTIAINSDTLVWAGTGLTGSRTLAAGSIATAKKVQSTRWMIQGSGLT